MFHLRSLVLPAAPHESPAPSHGQIERVDPARPLATARDAGRIVAALAVLLLLAAHRPAPAVAAGPPGVASQGPGAAPLPPGFAAVEVAGVDADGRPKAVVHTATGIRLVLIPAGEFLMGSPDDDPDRSRDERRHRRLIRQPFYLGATEVTAGQFRAFVEATGHETDAERGSPDGPERARGAFAMREGSATAGGRRRRAGGTRSPT